MSAALTEDELLDLIMFCMWVKHAAGTPHLMVGWFGAKKMMTEDQRSRARDAAATLLRSWRGLRANEERLQ